MRLIGCTGTSVAVYQPMPRNIPVERRPRVQGGGSMKSRIVTGLSASVKPAGTRSCSREASIGLLLNPVIYATCILLLYSFLSLCVPSCSSPWSLSTKIWYEFLISVLLLSFCYDELKITHVLSRAFAQHMVVLLGLKWPAWLKAN
jgi:hypothetical protein